MDTRQEEQFRDLLVVACKKTHESAATLQDVDDTCVKRKLDRKHRKMAETFCTMLLNDARQTLEHWNTNPHRKASFENSRKTVAVDQPNTQWTLRSYLSATGQTRIESGTNANGSDLGSPQHVHTHDYLRPLIQAEKALAPSTLGAYPHIITTAQNGSVRKTAAQDTVRRGSKCITEMQAIQERKHVQQPRWASQFLNIAIDSLKLRKPPKGLIGHQSQGYRTKLSSMEEMAA